MKTPAFVALIAFSLAACSTPVTTLKHPKTAAVATCGGGMAGSLTGGAVGYNIQKNNDADCVKQYQKQGYKIDSTNSAQ